MAPKLLRNAQWKRIEQMLSGKPGDVGRTGVENRLFAEAVLWIARTGSAWRDLSDEFRNWNSACVRYARWSPAHQHAAGPKRARSGCASAWPLARRANEQDPSHRRPPRPSGPQRPNRRSGERRDSGVAPAGRAAVRRADRGSG